MLSARTYFVAPNGSDEYRGNIAHPFASLNHAVEVAQAGDTLFFRQGIYHISESTPDPNDKRYNFICHFTRSGRQDAPIVFSGYKNERAVFDMSAVRPEKRRVVAFLLSADYLVFRQLEIIGVQVTQKVDTPSLLHRYSIASPSFRWRIDGLTMDQRWRKSGIRKEELAPFDGKQIYLESKLSVNYIQ